jgi:hypothetical protein
MTQGTLINVAPHNGNPDPNQRYTIRRAIEWCKRTAGVTEYDLDVAACEESHHAHLWYGVAENGLSLPWFGDVFCNPPWDDIEPWVQKAWAEFERPRGPEGDSLLASISMLLPGDRTHRPWWRMLVEPVRDRGGVLTVHFAPERFPYGGPGNPEGIGAPEPNFTSCLLVWRPR